MPPEVAVAEGARRLAAGEAIGFPTETVYGLGADAANATAVAKIFALKGRPADHPLIVHFADPADLARWAVDIPEFARTLAARFWPGPLTLILKRSSAVPDDVTGGQDTVGLRCPSHSMAQALLAEFGRIGSGAVAAPSANKFGHVSPTTAQHVRDEFGPELFVLDGGASDVGLESTIVDVSRGTPVLLRPGGIPRVRIEAALGRALGQDLTGAPRASGTLAAHYAPRTALALVDRVALASDSRGAAVLALGSRLAQAGAAAWIAAPDDAVRYGHDLYANLRTLDASGARRILVEAPPRTVEWEAVNDRLARAAAGASGLDDEP